MPHVDTPCVDIAAYVEAFSAFELVICGISAPYVTSRLVLTFFQPCEDLV